MITKVIPTLIMLMVPTIGNCISYNTSLNEFDSYDYVKYELIDAVKNGCFTNLNMVENYARSKIELSGMTLSDDGDHQYLFIVQAVGIKYNGLCQGSVTVGLYTETGLHTGVTGLVTIKEIGYNFRDVSFNEIVLDQVRRFFLQE